jgi:hypothetical protein
VTLREFLAASHNTKTREHMFFNRLYYDLKVAAARRGIHLSVFQPEVDRDGYDVVLDDGDHERRFQLKSFLKDAKTSRWDIGKGLLRPDAAYGEWLRLELPLCGYGGGVILIEIDASSDMPSVEYLYTDYFIISGLDARMWLETSSDKPKPGPPARLRAGVARDLLKSLWVGNRGDKIEVARQCFLRAKSSDALLAMAGMHSIEACHLPSNGIAQALSKHFEADDAGRPKAHVDKIAVGIAYEHAKSILALADEPNLRTFTWPYGSASP